MDASWAKNTGSRGEGCESGLRTLRCLQHGPVVRFGSRSIPTCEAERTAGFRLAHGNIQVKFLPQAAGPLKPSFLELTSDELQGADGIKSGLKPCSLSPESPRAGPSSSSVLVLWGGDHTKHHIYMYICLGGTTLKLQFVSFVHFVLGGGTTLKWQTRSLDFQLRK